MATERHIEGSDRLRWYEDKNVRRRLLICTSMTGCLEASLAQATEAVALNFAALTADTIVCVTFTSESGRKLELF